MPKMLMPSLADMVRAATIPSVSAQNRKDELRQRQLKLLEWIVSTGNVTYKQAADYMGCAEETVKLYMKGLHSEGRVSKWSVKGRFWFCASSAELARRKRKH